MNEPNKEVAEKMSERPTEKDFEEWIEKNVESVRDLAFRHYLQLGRGTIFVDLDSNTNKSAIAYLDRSGIEKVFYDNDKLLGFILEQTRLYDPDGQIVYVFSANGSTVSTGIIQTQKPFEKPPS